MLPEKYSPLAQLRLPDDAKRTVSRTNIQPLFSNIAFIRIMDTTLYLTL